MERVEIVLKGKKYLLPKGCTEQTFNDLIAKHGASRIKLARAQREENGAFDLDLILLVPDTHSTSDYMKFRQIQPSKAWDILNKNCVLFNQEAVLASDFTQITVAKLIETLIPIGQGEILN